MQNSALSIALLLLCVAALPAQAQIFATLPSNAVARLESDTGAVVWTTSLGRFVAFCGSRVFLAANNTFTSVDAVSGAKQWSVRLFGTAQAFIPYANVNDSAVVVVTNNNGTMALVDVSCSKGAVKKTVVLGDAMIFDEAAPESHGQGMRMVVWNRTSTGFFSVSMPSAVFSPLPFKAAAPLIVAASLPSPRFYATAIDFPTNDLQITAVTPDLNRTLGRVTLDTHAGFASASFGIWLGPSQRTFFAYIWVQSLATVSVGAYSSDNFTLLWRRDDLFYGSGVFAPTNDGVLISNGTKAVQLLDNLTGTTLWSRSIDTSNVPIFYALPTGFAVMNGFYDSRGAGNLTRFSSQGHPQWTVPVVASRGVSACAAPKGIWYGGQAPEILFFPYYCTLS